MSQTEISGPHCTGYFLRVRSGILASGKRYRSTRSTMPGRRASTASDVQIRQSVTFTRSKIGNQTSKHECIRRKGTTAGGRTYFYYRGSDWIGTQVIDLSSEVFFYKERKIVDGEIQSFKKTKANNDGKGPIRHVKKGPIRKMEI